MKFDRFEDILIWQRAKDLTLFLYKKLSGLKDFNYKNQIIKASVSIMNNIAEGFERKSNSEFRQFLYIAKGSSGEIRSMLILGNELDYFTSEDFQYLKSESESISKMLSALIKRL